MSKNDDINVTYGDGEFRGVSYHSKLAIKTRRILNKRATKKLRDKK